MPDQPAIRAAPALPVLNAAITAGMCRTTLRALGRTSALVSSRGTVVGVATAEALDRAGTEPGGSSRPVLDVAERTGLVWL